MPAAPACYVKYAVGHMSLFITKQRLQWRKRWYDIPEIMFFHLLRFMLTLNLLNQWFIELKLNP